ncbi:MAG: hypothetical protein HYY93_04750 [Planctomycetes bacterium]|nr:hypothetical protein [Planctomycetota bacterium]
MSSACLAAAVLAGLLGLLAAPGPGLAQAVPPGLIHLEGRLTNAGGVPANGATDIVLRLYDTGPGAGGTLLITDSHTGGGAVTVTNGIYAFDLGSGTITAGSKTTIGACFADVATVWLEMQVGAETLTPRTRMVSAAYALNSDTLDGRDSSYFATASGSAPVGSPYVTVGNDGTLTAERAIAVGLGLATSDGGANGSYTVSLDYSNTLGGNPAVAVNGTIFGSNGVLFEGATADTTEGILSPAALTGDQTWTLPDATGTLALTSQMAPIGAAYVLVSNDGTLTADRALAAGLGLSLTDGGANSSLTLGAH